MSVSDKLRDAAEKITRRFLPLVVAVVVLTLAGVALIFFDTKNSVGAGIAAVLAAFGVTWKGIGEFFGRAAAKGEEHLWDAELDWAIAYRFTLCRRLDDDEIARLPRAVGDRPARGGPLAPLPRMKGPLARCELRRT